MEKQKWSDLTHDKQITKLKGSTNAELMATFAPPADVALSKFEAFLEGEREFWQVDSLGDVELAGEPPNKDTLIGARRDLSKSRLFWNSSIIVLTPGTADGPTIQTIRQEPYRSILC